MKHKFPHWIYLVMLNLFLKIILSLISLTRLISTVLFRNLRLRRRSALLWFLGSNMSPRKIGLPMKRLLPSHLLLIILTTMRLLMTKKLLKMDPNLSTTTMKVSTVPAPSRILLLTCYMAWVLLRKLKGYSSLHYAESHQLQLLQVVASRVHQEQDQVHQMQSEICELYEIYWFVH